MAGENEENSKLETTENAEGNQPESKPETEDAKSTEKTPSQSTVKQDEKDKDAESAVATGSVAAPPAEDQAATAAEGGAGENAGQEKPAEGPQEATAEKAEAPEGVAEGAQNVEGGAENVEGAENAEAEGVEAEGSKENLSDSEEKQKEDAKTKKKKGKKSSESLKAASSGAMAAKGKKGGKKGGKKKGGKGKKSSESLKAASSGAMVAGQSSGAVGGKGSKGKVNGTKSKKGKGKKKKHAEEDEHEEEVQVPPPEPEVPVVELTEEEQQAILEKAYESAEDLEKRHRRKGKSKASSLRVIKSHEKSAMSAAGSETMRRILQKSKSLLGTSSEELGKGRGKKGKRSEINQLKGKKKGKGSESEMKSPSEESSTLGSTSTESTTSSASERRRLAKEAQKEEVVLESEEPKVKEKGKRGAAKGPKVVIKEETPSITESMQMLQEMQKIKAGAQEPETETVPDEASTKPSEPAGGKKGAKKKKGPKKPHKEKEPKQKKAKRMTAKQMQEWLIQQEVEAAKKAEEERLRLEKEKEALVEQEMIERYEQITRKEQLQPIIDLAKELEEADAMANWEIAEAEEWERYLRCDGLPKVTDSGEMYTYLYRINLTRDEVDIQAAAEKTNEILGLLNTLEKRITNPLKDDTRQNIEAWKEIRHEFRDVQQDRLDVATYSLLRDVHQNLERKSIPLADYSRIEENFIMCLWVAVEQPTPMVNPRRPPKPRATMDFPQMEMNVLFPQGYNYDLMAVRGMYLKYDHVSDMCETYNEPNTPDILKIDLNEAMEREYISKMKTAFQLFERKKTQKKKKNTSVVTESAESEEGNKEDKKEEPPEPEINVDELDDETILGYQTEVPITVAELDLRVLDTPVLNMVIEHEDFMYEEALNSLKKDVELPTINLREYAILGGLYFVDLYYQPPQPREFVGNETILFSIQLPKELHEVDFYAEYVPPNIENDGTKSGPEIQEEELKYQEAEYEKLILITLNLPKHIIWIAPPKVCQWDKINLQWTTKDIYGEKYNEEKQFIEFRTGRFGIFGLAVYKYANLPYQSWDIVPQKNGQVMVRYTTAILAIDFMVNEDQICLYKLKNSPNNTADHITGVYCKLQTLKQMMLECGIDIFPCQDTFLYVKGTCQKHWPMEKHLYYSISMLYSTFNFSWSRWNMSAGRRSIVFQMREYFPEKLKQIPYSMVLVTPQRATLIDSTEVSSIYNEESLPNIKFCPDLTTLIKATTPITTRMKLNSSTSHKMAHTIANLLIETKIFSFS